jgi:hypothetical protein
MTQIDKFGAFSVLLESVDVSVFHNNNNFSNNGNNY